MIVVQIKSKDINFPNFCTCCGKPTTNSYLLNSWQIPICPDCQRHSNVRNPKEWLIAAYLVGIFGLILFILPGVILFLLLYRIYKKKLSEYKSLQSANCTAVNNHVKYMGWNGVVFQFGFTNQLYVDELLKLNDSQIVQNKGFLKSPSQYDLFILKYNEIVNNSTLSTDIKRELNILKKEINLYLKDFNSSYSEKITKAQAYATSSRGNLAKYNRMKRDSLKHERTVKSNQFKQIITKIDNTILQMEKIV